MLMFLDLARQFFDEPPLEKLAPSGGSAVHEVTRVDRKSVV